MERKMTRIEAANRLGVEPQTITNWVERGLLGGYSDKKSKRFYVNGDDIKKYAEQYNLLSVSEESLKAKVKELQDKEREVDARYDMLLRDELLIQNANNKYFRECMVILYKKLSDRGERSTNIIVDFLNGLCVKDIADKRSMTRERIRQVVIKGLMAFVGDVGNVLSELKENEELREEVQSLKEKLNVAFGAREQIEQHKVFPKVFFAKLSDFNISVRSWNAMRGRDIHTIGELVQHTMSDIKNTRSLGRKSFGELDDLVKTLGLEWGMSGAKIYVKGVQQMRDEAKLDMMFNDVIFSLSGEMARRYDIGISEAMNRTFEEMSRFVDRERNRIKNSCNNN